MPKINRDGINIHYEVHGSGPPLLLTHGYSSTSGMWQGQIEALSKHHKLVLWDMRGHGQSDYPDDPSAYSEALTVADMAALCKPDAIHWCDGSDEEYDRLCGKLVEAGTFRKLDPALTKDLDAAKAVALMLEYPSAIKRPVLVQGSRTLVGFKPEAYQAAFPGQR